MGSSIVRSALVLIAAIIVASSPATAPAQVTEESGTGVEALAGLQADYEKAMSEGRYDDAVGIVGKIAGIAWPLHTDCMFNTARALSRAGKRSEAYQYLFWAVDSGFWDMDRMMKEPDFESLREEPLFRKLARTARANGYIWMLERDEREEFQMSDRIMESLDLRPGLRVADLGCGSGYFTIPVARAVMPGGTVLAIDAWQEMLDYLERRLEIEGLGNVEPVKVERDDPRLPPAGVDLILMVDVYHYIQERIEYGKKLRAGLAPGGRLVVIDYIPKSLEERPWGPPPQQHLSKEQLTADLEQAGLRLVKEYDFLPEQYFVVYEAQ
jgi:ubiquinone/menaquinone biosynthesis C-methylase UbiE